MQVTGLDHIVLVVRDVERSLAWYRDELGMEAVREDEWRAGEAPFVSVRADATCIVDLFPGDPDGTNVDHFCLVIDEPVDDVAASGRFEVEHGPADFFGAQGTGRSIYVRDPDGHKVELRSY